jgi:hypothetical protein
MIANLLLKPWMAPLMRQRTLCRWMVVTVLLLFAGSRMGWSLFPCPFAKLTGLPCPGCGMTRAMMAMLHGNWALVVRLHPFAPFFALTGGLCGLVSLLPLGLAERITAGVDAFERRTRLPAAILLLFACFGLLRLLGFWYHPLIPDPSAPFQRPAIHREANQPHRTPSTHES